MYRHKETVESINSLPNILSLNSAGEPMGWITYDRCAFYYAKDKILWSMGQYEVVLRGGTNAKTGQQSVLTMDTIVAIDTDTNLFKHRKASTPNLSNKTLFERDNNICAYCGQHYKRHQLTRDHVVPTSRGGPNTWDNVVTACDECNNWKRDRTPEEADMQLLYVPYTPSFHEHLILQNRNILACQMEYLMKGVGPNSRIRLNS